MIRWLARRLLRDLLLVALTALAVHGAVALLPVKVDADAKVPALRSVSLQLQDDLGAGRPLGFLRPWQKLLAGERLGDGARSYSGAEIARALAGSLRVGALALGLALAGGIAFALLAVALRRTAAGPLIDLLPSLAYGTPAFLLALAVATRTSVATGDDLAAFEPVMAAVIAVWPACFLGSLLADALRRELALPYVRAALARGRSRPGAALHHALPNALPVLLDALPPVGTAVLTGSFAVEKLFNVTYFGFLYVDSAVERQLGVVVVATTLFAAVLVGLSLVADVLRRALDPRAAGAEEPRP